MRYRDEDIVRLTQEKCIEVALKAYEDAGFSGLCAEGRWEYALEAIKNIDVQSIIRT